MRTEEVRARRASLVAQIASGTRYGYADRVARARAGLQALAAAEALAAITLPITPEDAKAVRAAAAGLPVERGADAPGEGRGDPA